MASSSNLNALDTSSSKSSSPSSPSSPIGTLPPRTIVNLSVRGQNNVFPPTPTTSNQPGGFLEPPAGVSYKEFIGTWSDAHVSRWLSDIKCGNHATTFKDNDIRGDILLELDQVTLKEMGVASIGDRLRIVNAVKTLRQKCAAPPPPKPVSTPTSTSRRPRVVVNGEYTDEQKSSEPESAISPTTRLASRSGRPAPLQLNHQSGRGDLPRLVREPGLPESANSNSSRQNNVRPLPHPVQSSSSLNSSSSINGSASSIHTPTANSAARANLPPLPPAPRGQPPPPPPGRTAANRPLQYLNTPPSGRRTPTQTDVPSYASQPLPPAPQMGGMLTPGTANSQSNWTGYGLPADPRPGNAGGKPNARSTSPLPPQPGSANSRTTTRSPNPGAHARNVSLGVNSPNASSSVHKLPPRPSTTNSSHPYAVSQPSGLQPRAGPAADLSPIAESFMSQHSTSTAGTNSPPTPFSVGRGPFKGSPASSHTAAPSLDVLRGMLVKFVLPEEGHSRKINVADCAGGIEVLEKVLKKFGKARAEGSMAYVETEDGGLTVDGWGVYLDWGNGEGLGMSTLLNGLHYHTHGICRVASI